MKRHCTGRSLLVALCVGLLLVLSPHAGADGDKDVFRVKPVDPTTWKTAETDRLLAATVLAMDDLPLEQRLLVAMEVGKKASADLFKVDRALERKYAKVLEGKENAGINRILERQIFGASGLGAIVPLRGGGVYFSFTTRSNDYDAQPDIELQNGRFSSGFAGGDFGLVRVFDGTPLEEFTLDSVPPVISEPDVKKLHALARRSRGDRPMVAVGKTYIVRSIRYRRADTLAVLRVVSKDDFGVTFVWKVLKRFPVPSRR
jgi:hypothetical protein